MHLVLVNHLGSLPRNSDVRLTDQLDMNVVVDWDIKPQMKQANKQIKVLFMTVVLAKTESVVSILKPVKMGYVFHIDSATLDSY